MTTLIAIVGALALASIPLIIGWRRESHDERLSLNDVLREFEIAV
jgi:hypothetical protein